MRAQHHVYTTRDTMMARATAKAFHENLHIVLLRFELFTTLNVMAHRERNAPKGTIEEIIQQNTHTHTRAMWRCACQWSDGGGKCALHR